MFTKQFDTFVCDGDKIMCVVDGFDCVATTVRDDNGDAPDQRDVGFWPNLDKTSAGYIGDRTEAELAAETAKAQAVMDAWLNGEWDYCGVCVVVSFKGVPLTPRYANALWGVERNYPESDNSYLAQVANELLGEALEQAKAKIAELCEKVVYQAMSET